jgi:1-phosphofructokinase
VVTGQSEEILPVDFYRRLGHDLASGGIQVVADLHGPELWSFLEGGPIEILKVSDEDLRNDGTIEHEHGVRSLTHAISELTGAGARSVIVSRQDKPAIARFDDVWLEVRTPELDPADHRGAGDSMTAGLAAGLRRSLSTNDIIRLGCAAGAANVTRHGLGSADAELIPGLVDRVEISNLSPLEV